MRTMLSIFFIIVMVFSLNCFSSPTHPTHFYFVVYLNEVERKNVLACLWSMPGEEIFNMIVFTDKDKSNIRLLEEVNPVVKSEQKKLPYFITVVSAMMKPAVMGFLKYKRLRLIKGEDNGRDCYVLRMDSFFDFNGQKHKYSEYIDSAVKLPYYWFLLNEQFYDHFEDLPPTVDFRFADIFIGYYKRISNHYGEPNVAGEGVQYCYYFTEPEMTWHKENSNPEFYVFRQSGQQAGEIECWWRFYPHNHEFRLFVGETVEIIFVRSEDEFSKIIQLTPKKEQQANLVTPVHPSW